MITKNEEEQQKDNQADNNEDKIDILVEEKYVENETETKEVQNIVNVDLPENNEVPASLQFIGYIVEYL